MIHKRLFCAGFLEELIAADQLLSTTGGTVEGDLIYGNDITRWKQLAHSLRLRIALELADRDEDTARRVIASLWDNRNSVIDSNDAIARFVLLLHHNGIHGHLLSIHVMISGYQKR